MPILNGKKVVDLEVDGVDSRDYPDFAGWTLEKALEECCLRGWQAFKADWVAKKANPADIVRITVPSKNEPDPALEKIKEDEKKAAPIPLEVLAKMAELRKKA